MAPGPIAQDDVLVTIFLRHNKRLQQTKARWVSAATEAPSSRLRS